MPAHLLKLLATPIFSNTSLRPRSGHPVASIAADDLEAEERHRRESQHVFHRGALATTGSAAGSRGGATPG
jgi:hypothetical protein